MSLTSSTQDIRVQSVSGHDMSHRNTLTATCGTLVPILSEEVVPNSRCHLKTSFSVKLPPLASETFANVDYRIEAFFVPHRLISPGFTDFITGAKSAYSTGTYQAPKLPYIQVKPTTPETQAAWNKKFSPGTLCDYLGFRKGINFVSELEGGQQTLTITPLPFLAYNLIYDYWYRNKLVQRPVFMYDSNTDNARKFYNLCKFYGPYSSNSYIGDDNMSDFDMADGRSLFDLRQRNFDSDYFTTATTTPQLGGESSVSIEVPASDQKTITSFTIAALRSANAMQQFAERNNLLGVDDVNFYKGMFGARLDYGVAQHPVCLGSASVPIYVNGVFQQTPVETASTRNPFLSVGAQYGTANSCTTEVVIEDFTAMEYGYIMVIGSLVPRVSYASGIRPMLTRHTSSSAQNNKDFANPIMQQIGPEPIYCRQLAPIMDSGKNQVFGYQPRFSSWITHPDEVHGQFIDGETLDSFVLQRSFYGYTPVLSSSFLEIPTTYLDQVFAMESVSTLDKGFSYWVDMLHEWHITCPLQDFVIPSLQDPAYEHGVATTVRKNGAPMINR